MYVAKDDDGRVYLYDTKPFKDELLGMWSVKDGKFIKIDVDELPKSINPQWDDPEPIEVKLVRKNK